MEHGSIPHPQIKSGKHKPIKIREAVQKPQEMAEELQSSTGKLSVVHSTISEWKSGKIVEPCSPHGKHVVRSHQIQAILFISLF